jgi:ABC-type nitrate/sulfonate/bicarbonate transport system substrate-binding protein
MTTRIFTWFAGGVAAGACMLAVMTCAQAQTGKLWRHGILSPKADAGFMEMAAKRGFAEREGLKVELVEFKDDPIGLKALLAGEIDSYEGGVQGPIAADVRGGDIKIIGCYWPIVPHGLMVKTTSTRSRTSRASRSRCRRRARSPTCWRASRWRNTTSKPPT